MKAGSALKLFSLSFFLFLSQSFAQAYAMDARLEIAKSLESLEGKKQVFQPRTDSALVVFWATWCTSCRVELRKDIPLMAARKDITVITINTENDERERVQNFVKKERMELPVYFDSAGEFQAQRPAETVPYWIAWKKGPAGWKVVDSDVVFNKERILKSLALPPSG